MNKKIFLNLVIFFRYLLFLPVAIIGSILFAFIIHLIIKGFCFFPGYWMLDACKVERPFFVELILLFSFIQLSVLIIPKFKKIIALLELIPISLFYILISLLSLFTNKAMSNWFDIFFLGLLGLLTAFFIIKDIKNLRIIVFNSETHFYKLKGKNQTDNNSQKSFL